MSQPYFENRYFGTDEMLREYVTRVLCRKIFGIGAVVTLAALVLAILSGAGGDAVFCAVFGVCFGIALLTVLLTPTLTFRQMKTETLRLHNGQTFETVVQFGQRILLREGDFSLACDYGQIHRIYRLKHSWVLMFGTQNGIMIDPEHFSIGTLEDFEAFLQERCPQAR